MSYQGGVLRGEKSRLRYRAGRLFPTEAMSGALLKRVKGQDIKRGVQVGREQVRTVLNRGKFVQPLLVRVMGWAVRLLVQTRLLRSEFSFDGFDRRGPEHRGKDGAAAPSQPEHGDVLSCLLHGGAWRPVTSATSGFPSHKGTTGFVVPTLLPQACSIQDTEWGWFTYEVGRGQRHGSRTGELYRHAGLGTRGRPTSKLRWAAPLDGFPV